MFITHFKEISEEEKRVKIKEFKEFIEKTFIIDDYELWKEKIDYFFNNYNSLPIIKKNKTEVNLS